MSKKHTEVVESFRKSWLDKSIFNHLLKANKIVFAFSGGLDSCVLVDSFLYFLKELNIKNYKNKVLLCHVNHNLSRHAHSWVEHCVSYADKWGVPLVVEKIEDTNFNGDGLELWPEKQDTVFLQALSKMQIPY